MSRSIETYFSQSQQRYQYALSRHLTALNDAVTPIGDLSEFVAACRYSLEIGGKRIRPMLCFSAADAIRQVEQNTVDDLACALELIHTYSLIHDDLPAMDDDDLRRGQPSLHKAYDEATAILAGDGLQAQAFQLIAEAPGLAAEQRIEMVGVLARAIGPSGMVGGQFIDIRATDSELNLEQLQGMHALKTGALIRAALALGGIAANGSEAQLAALDEYGTHIGLAFQIVDDILDVEGDTATLGKTQGKDLEANKATYVSHMGLQGAKDEAQSLLAKAIGCLEGFGEPAEPLRELARYIVQRRS